MSSLSLTAILGVLVLAIPAAAFVLMAGIALLPGRPSERLISSLSTGALVLSWLTDSSL